MTTRGGRAAVRMSEAETEDFLGSAMKVQVATVNADGSPHLTTLFYVLDEGRVAFWTYARSQKIRNLERDPRVACLVETGEDYFALRGVSLSGTAEIIRDRGSLLRIGTAVAQRMAGVRDAAALGELGRSEVQRQAQKRVAVVVTAQKVATWDHRKMLAAGER